MQSICRVHLAAQSADSPRPAALASGTGLALSDSVGGRGAPWHVGPPSRPTGNAAEFGRLPAQRS